jgi:hypothetical protein
MRIALQMMACFGESVEEAEGLGAWRRPCRMRITPLAERARHRSNLNVAVFVLCASHGST